MLTFSKRGKKTVGWIICLIWIMTLPACSIIDSLLNSAKKNGISRRTGNVVYIQSFTGQEIKEFQEIFFQTVREQNAYTFLELLPDQMAGLSVLRIEVLDHNIWENEEIIPMFEEDALSKEQTMDIMLRRNAIVRIKVSLFDAATGNVIVRKIISQPFQQIYYGEESINNRPSRKMEFLRLSKLLIFRMMDSFQTDSERNELQRLEEGDADSWIIGMIRNSNSHKIRKANRFAKAGDFDQAVLIWKVVLFSPSKEKHEFAFLKDRASIYYNLGIIFKQQGDLIQAAEMFSRANRLIQKLKYAQAWGETMQQWLQLQKNGKKPVKTEEDQEMAVQKTLDDFDSTETISSDRIKYLERNNRLLLNAKDLWPLEPIIKNYPSNTY